MVQYGAMHRIFGDLHFLSNMHMICYRGERGYMTDGSAFYDYVSSKAIYASLWCPNTNQGTYFLFAYVYFGKKQ